MGVDRSPRLESTKSLTAQNTRSSHRSSSPVNRLATTAKEKDLRTTVLTKQSNRMSRIRFPIQTNLSKNDCTIAMITLATKKKKLVKRQSCHQLIIFLNI